MKLLYLDGLKCPVWEHHVPTASLLSYKGSGFMNQNTSNGLLCIFKIAFKEGKEFWAYTVLTLDLQDCGSLKKQIMNIFA